MGTRVSRLTFFLQYWEPTVDGSNKGPYFRFPDVNFHIMPDLPWPIAHLWPSCLPREYQLCLIHTETRANFIYWTIIIISVSYSSLLILWQNLWFCLRCFIFRLNCAPQPLRTPTTTTTTTATTTSTTLTATAFRNVSIDGVRARRDYTIPTDLLALHWIITQKIFSDKYFWLL